MKPYQPNIPSLYGIDLDLEEIEALNAQIDRFQDQINSNNNEITNSTALNPEFSMAQSTAFSRDIRNMRAARDALISKTQNATTANSPAGYLPPGYTQGMVPDPSVTQGAAAAAPPPSAESADKKGPQR